ncbi:HAMP domain-containing histidine kinase [Oxalobacteraceae bacterium]|nr:HAMP domain-containing histidine kinase [Oxalobacteraceae bacterium]
MRWPRLRSFRLRITLVATGTATAAILVLFLASAFTIYQRRQHVLDRIQTSHLNSPVLMAETAAQWHAIEVQLDASFSGFSADTPDGPRVLLLAQSGDGRTLYRSAHWPAALQPVRAEGLVSREFAGQTWRVGHVQRGALTVWICVNHQLSYRQLNRIMTRFGMSIVPLIAALALLAWYLAGRAMRPIEHLHGAMRRVRGGELSERVSDLEEDREFRRLVEVFNEMMDRLERNYLQAIRFSGDAAHELKTPLTILQGELERCFAHAEADPALERDLADMLGEVRRLDSIVKKLLLLSRADAGQLQLPRLTLDLRPLLDDLAEDISLHDVELRLALPPGVAVQGDHELLTQLLQNLVSNALKYRAPQGWIGLSARRSAGVWEIDVANASDGITPEHREQLFARFFRGDHAHNRRVPGVGLGLALSREIARAHAGDLVFAEAPPGQVVFRLSLPAAIG